MPSKHRGKWRARWTDEHGKRQSALFFSKREAEAFERRKKAEVDDVHRGLRAPRGPERTVGDALDVWLENRAKIKRSGKHDKSIIKAHLRPAFGVLKLTAFHTGHTDAFCLERTHLGKKTLNNHLTLLVSVLNYVKDMGWVERVPRIRKPRVRVCDKDFAFLRTSDEIRRFLAAAEEEGPLVFALYATDIYTGLRAGEQAGMEWPQIDLDRRLITVDRSYDGPTKAEDIRYVPILDPLLPVLREWRLRCPSKLVFPNQRGAMQQPSARVFQEVLHRVLARAGFPKRVVGGRERWFITYHGLRHTFATCTVGWQQLRAQSIGRTLAVPPHTCREARHCPPTPTRLAHGRPVELWHPMGSCDG